MEAIAGVASLGGLAVWSNPEVLRPWLRPLGFLVACALVLHLVLEGWRLQAVPIYVAALLLCAVSGYPRSTASASSLCALAGLLLCYSIPVFGLAAPRGRFPIASKTLYLTDTARQEEHGGGPRRFAAEVWYPAAPGPKGARAVYRDPRTLLVRSYHHRLVRTNSFRDTPAAASESAWPVVIFSPSSGGNRAQNTVLCEELASQGYVVVGLDHPYSSSRVAFPDGTIIYSLPTDWLHISTREQWQTSIPIVEATLETRVGDALYAMEVLAEKTGLRVDPERAAAIGHSFGGAVAAELCRRDKRFRTGANFDGWMFSGVRESGVAPNFLFAIEDDPLWSSNDGPYPDNFDGNVRLGTRQYHDTIRRSLKRYGGYLWRPTNAGHADFSDLALYLRWPFPGQFRGHEGLVHQLHEKQREIVVALLNQHLKGEAAPILKQFAYAKEEL